MKKLITILFSALFCIAAGAQGYYEAADTTAAVHPDSLYCNTAIVVDSDYAGQSIFGVMPSRSRGDAATVTVNQCPEVRIAMQRRIMRAKFKPLQGYRIRIFFSNAQNAREASLSAAALFGAHYSGHNIYRSFVNPNFKVTVGDFRTRSEALALLNSIKGEFPGAFIVKETIHYTY